MVETTTNRRAGRNKAQRANSIAKMNDNLAEQHISAKLKRVVRKFCETLSQLRHEFGVTQAEMAEVLDYSAVQYRRYETIESYSPEDIPLSFLFKVSGLLQIPASQLLNSLEGGNPTERENITNALAQQVIEGNIGVSRSLAQEFNSALSNKDVSSHPLIEDDIKLLLEHLVHFSKLPDSAKLDIQEATLKERLKTPHPQEENQSEAIRKELIKLSQRFSLN